MIDPDTLEVEISLHAEEKLDGFLAELRDRPDLCHVSLQINDLDDLKQIPREKEILDAISHLTRLESLRVEANLTDLDFLTPLRQLRSLDLAGNCITSIEALAGLDKMVNLELAENFIRELRPLSGMKLLRSVYLISNFVSDFSPLFGVARAGILERLWLDCNPLDQEKLAEFNEIPGVSRIEFNGEVYGYSNIFRDPQVLYFAKDENPEHPELTDSLWLGAKYGPHVRTLEGVEKLTCVKKIRLSPYQTENDFFGHLKRFPALEMLFIDRVDTKNLSRLLGLRLTALTVHSGKLTDISLLPRLGTNFRWISLEKNEINNISVLDDMLNNGMLAPGAYIDLRQNPLGKSPNPKIMQNLRQAGMRLITSDDDYSRFYLQARNAQEERPEDWELFWPNN